ncbi:MAG: hypothetical protein HUU01_23070 [Saprospiraceae bacterium]|nr:hypothetical protein [Saprospiraceae bacterium]
MSVCDVKYLPENNQFTLKFKFFWDDLQATLEKETGKKISLTQVNPENDRLVADFVRRQFDLKVNNNFITLQHVRSEVQDVVLLVEFSGKSLRPASSYAIDLRNEILMAAFSDQYNIVRFDFFGDGNYETLRFERAERHLTKTVKRS